MRQIAGRDAVAEAKPFLRIRRMSNRVARRGNEFDERVSVQPSVAAHTAADVYAKRTDGSYGVCHILHA
jgi:hypothetical protein